MLAANAGPDVGKLFNDALACHRADQLELAKKKYEHVRQLNPRHALTNYMLGLLYRQLEAPGQAADCFRSAVACEPANATFHNSLGEVLLEEKLFDAAQSCFLKAVELNPADAEAMNNMGNLLARLGRDEEALKWYRDASRTAPGFVAARFNLGSSYQKTGRYEAAVAEYEAAVGLHPQFSAAYLEMGNAYRALGQFRAAEEAFGKAHETAPDDGKACGNLGGLYQDQGRLAAAAAWYEKAIAIDPVSADYQLGLGITYQLMGRFPQAIRMYQTAIKINPDSAGAYYQLGALFQLTGDTDQAIDCLERALAIEPDHGHACAVLYHQLQINCAWHQMDGVGQQLTAISRQALAQGSCPGETPFINLIRCDDSAFNLAVARQWSHEVERAVAPLKIDFPFETRPVPRGKITIGYLSSDFYDHATAHLMRSFFALHDRNRFNVFAYSYGTAADNAYRRKIARDCDRFVEIGASDYVAAAQRIHGDRVDILVDLKGHTFGTRMEIPALRPAPVQVSWLGFPGSTGAAFIDYLVTDGMVTPDSEIACYSEKLVYMPHCYQVTDCLQEISHRDYKRGDFELPDDNFVFCSFNASYKIDRDMFMAWLQILDAVPGSVLWLLSDNPTAEQNLRNTSRKHGVAPDRLIFSPRMAKADHLKRIGLADLALDTRLVNGHTTTSDTLWAGVPVVSMQGKHFASRVSASILCAMGLPELVTSSVEAYARLAIRLAGDPDLLSGIREKLRDTRLSAPLFDTPQFVRDLEYAFERMWRDYLAGKAPEIIDLRNEAGRG